MVGITPSLLPSFHPSAFIMVTFFLRKLPFGARQTVRLGEARNLKYTHFLELQSIHLILAIARLWPRDQKVKNDHFSRLVSSLRVSMLIRPTKVEQAVHRASINTFISLDPPSLSRQRVPFKEWKSGAAFLVRYLAT